VSESGESLGEEMRRWRRTGQGEEMRRTGQGEEMRRTGQGWGPGGYLRVFAFAKWRGKGDGAGAVRQEVSRGVRRRRRRRRCSSISSRRRRRKWWWW